MATNNAGVIFGKLEEEAITASESLALAVVDLRPLDNFDAEFGFDWYRLGDNGINDYKFDDPSVFLGKVQEITYNKTDPNKIEDVKLDKKALKTAEFKNRILKVIKGSTTSTIEVDEYYVPILHLYTKKVRETVKAGEKPPYTATLKVLAAIEEDLDKIEIECKSPHIKIDKAELNYKNKRKKTDPGSETITITCDSDTDGFDSDQEINFWAYKNSTKKLAGRFIVGKNSKKYRNNDAKVLWVPITTQIEGPYENIGEYITDSTNNDNLELNILRRFFYHTLSFLTTETYNPGLDLTDVNDFKISAANDTVENVVSEGKNKGLRRGEFGKYIFNKLLDPSDIPPDMSYNKGINVEYKGLHNALEDLFYKSLEKNKISRDRYKGYKLIFVFEEYASLSVIKKVHTGYFAGYPTYKDMVIGGVGGWAESEEDGNNSLILLKNRKSPSDPTVLAHEMLHLYLLEHPFSLKSNYVFKEPSMDSTGTMIGATDNIMDYGLQMRKHLWKWQWEIVNTKIK